MVEEYLKTLNLHNSELDFHLLNELVKGHISTFPFSSAGCQLGDDLPLDFTSLYQRIVVNRRGGYCFEHNGLLFTILEELGFAPQLFLARVIHNKDIYPGLTHRITIVKYQGQQYVIDVGFGHLGPTRPIPISGEKIIDGTKTFRIAEIEPGQYHMQVFKDDDFFSLYRFELVRYGQQDCELGHFYSHQHPQAVFVNNLVASLITENETRSLVNLQYWLITEHDTTIHDIQEAKEFEHILVKEFKLQFSEQECQQLFEKLATSKYKEKRNS